MSLLKGHKKWWLLLLIPFISYFTWVFWPKKESNILIYDKTVLDTDVAEHLSFNWVINYHRYTKPNSKNPYNPSKDYKGFFPQKKQKFDIKDFESLNDHQLDSVVSQYDLLYYTDMYGIYKLEWYANEGQLERSGKLYGGTSLNDYKILEKSVEQKKLLLTEFNLFASPTSRIIRKKCEKLLGVEWSGWTGRYFATLDTNLNKELPRWLKKGYLRQHKNKWPFKKSGIVFVHESEKIEILENETHLKFEMPIITSSEKSMDYFDMKEKVAYPFWFDIISAKKKEAEVISSYVVHANNKGLKQLQKWKIPNTFPAAITSNDSLSYYFCGDFADNPINDNLSYLKGITIFKNFLYSSRNLTDRNQFFWKYYYPLINTILENNPQIVKH